MKPKSVTLGSHEQTIDKCAGCFNALGCGKCIVFVCPEREWRNGKVCRCHPWPRSKAEAA